MRQFIDIIAQPLCEAKTEVVELYGRDVRVFINPTAPEYQNIINSFEEFPARGIIDETGNLYIFDGSHGIHSDVQRLMNLGRITSLFVTGATITVLDGARADIVKSNPNIQRCTRGVDIRIVDNREEPLYEAIRWSTLYWFWYNPATKQFEDVDGTHTNHAAYNMGFTPEGHQKSEGFDLEDGDVINAAIAAGWVRGRYGDHVLDTVGHRSFMTWKAGYDDRLKSFDLSLQGRPADVLETARFIARKVRVKRLYVDFDGGAKMESRSISGPELVKYLERGVLNENEDIRRFADKPAYIIPYDEGEMVGNVYENPSALTFKQCVGKHGARGLIRDDGRLLIWPELSMFHSDVTEALNLSAHSMMFYKNEVCVKGGDLERDEFAECTDDGFISLLRGIRVLNKVYGEGFRIEEGDWG